MIQFLFAYEDTYYLIAYLAVQLHEFWGRRKVIYRVLVLAMVCTHGASLLLLCASGMPELSRKLREQYPDSFLMHTFSDQTTYNTSLSVCSLRVKPRVLAPAWALIVRIPYYSSHDWSSVDGIIRWHSILWCSYFWHWMLSTAQGVVTSNYYCILRATARYSLRYA